MLFIEYSPCACFPGKKGGGECGEKKMGGKKVMFRDPKMGQKKMVKDPKMDGEKLMFRDPKNGVKK
jgi:hypothetical protein